MSRFAFSFLVFTLLALPRGMADDNALVLNARSRTVLEVSEKTMRWDPKETAIVICDMWDMHWCKCATQRVAEMAPRMNEVVKAARSKGIFIIHAPSSCMNFYKDTPQRKLAMSAPVSPNAPKDIDQWCRRLEKEPDYPIDDKDGGCDDVPASKSFQAWKRQVAAIDIVDGDA